MKLSSCCPNCQGELKRLDWMLLVCQSCSAQFEAYPDGSMNPRGAEASVQRETDKGSDLEF